MPIVTNILDFARHKSYRLLTITTLLIISVGTVVYHFAEGWSWLDSLYFTVITLTTVGYGDFSPQTVFGKIFTIFFILTGIGIILGFINSIYQHRVSKIEKLRKKRKSKKK